ncbi:MAG: VWA domain-containing protein [Myxococcota bacterium]
MRYAVWLSAFGIACSGEAPNLELEEAQSFVSQTCQPTEEIQDVHFGSFAGLSLEALLAQDFPLELAAPISAIEILTERGFQMLPPCCEGPACLQTMVGMIDEGSPRRSMLVGVNARVPPTPPPAIDVVVVLDVSASLRTPEVENAIRLGLGGLADELRPEDRLALVTFRGNIELAVPLDFVADVGRQFKREVGKVRFGGSTDLLNGLVVGFQHAREHFDPSRPSTVLLVTDGNPSFGNSSAADITRALSFGLSDGILLSTFVVGEQATDAVLRDVVESSGGDLEVVDPALLPEVLERAAGLGLRPLVQNLELQVELAGVERVLAIGAKEAVASANSFTLARDVVVRTPTGRTRSPGFGGAGGPFVWIEYEADAAFEPRALVRLRYQDLDGRTWSFEEERALVLERPGEPSAFDPPEMAQNVLRRDFAEAVSDALASRNSDQAAAVLLDLEARFEDFLAPRPPTAIAEQDLAALRGLLARSSSNVSIETEFDAWPGT